MVARLHATQAIEAYLERHGEPIRYGYVRDAFPLEAYQNVYARSPGSSEMPSAGRPFTAQLIRRLVAKGVELAPLTLHAGVSSPERHEPPFPEEFELPKKTAALVNGAQRVIAVGTTVVRALETQARPDGTVRPGAGWTKLVITPRRGLRAIDGLITGWHEPEASHLQLLEAAAVLSYSSAPTGPRWRTGIDGTSSATPTWSCLKQDRRGACAPPPAAHAPPGPAHMCAGRLLI